MLGHGSMLPSIAQRSQRQKIAKTENRWGFFGLIADACTRMSAISNHRGEHLIRDFLIAGSVGETARTYGHRSVQYIAHQG